MRNYTSKTHTKPVVSNAFKRTERVYPDPVPLAKQPQIPTQLDFNYKSQKAKRMQNQVMPIVPRNRKGRIVQKYYLYLQNHVNILDRHSNMQIQDNKCLWFKCIQKLPNRQHKAIFKRTQYVISEWTGDQFPNVLYLTLQGVWGFLNEHSVVTDRVCALQLVEITSSYHNDIAVYQLRYSSKSDSHWDIPSELTHLKMGVKIDNGTENIELPLPNPLQLQLDLIEEPIEEQ